MKVLVAGAGGFIGGYITKYFLKNKFSVIAVDIKNQTDWYQVHPNSTNVTSDLRDDKECYSLLKDVDQVVNLACDMGGMGFIENNKAKCMLSVLINTNLLNNSLKRGVKKFFFSSSACVYAANKQKDLANPFLKEEDAYPADPEDGYGWEKLFSERMCRHFREDYNLDTYIARFHNVYGPNGTWNGGREKAPAALCRKFIEAKYKKNKSIEIWGDGNQLRSFMYVDDCVEGSMKLMNSNFFDPINIGSAELVSINQMCDILEKISKISPKRNYILDAPKGVRARCSDNTLIRKKFNWEPNTTLFDGLSKTYKWIENQYLEKIN